MGESGTRCSKESRSNGYDERERRGNPDAPTDEVEGLHRLSKAELRDQEGPLLVTVHRPDPGLTRRDCEVIDFTRYRVKNYSELTNFGNL